MTEANQPENQAPASSLRRGIAKGIDLAIGAIIAFLVAVWPFAVFSALLLLWDLLPGGSLGKRLVGLSLVSQDGTPAAFHRRLLRNVILALPGPLGLFSVVGWGAATVAVFGLEAALAFLHPEGFRLGDRLCKTKVIEAEPEDGTERPSFTKPDV